MIAFYILLVTIFVLCILKHGKQLRSTYMKKESLPLVDIKDMAIYTGLSLISKGLKATPLKLQKILYYEQAWFMVFFGRENTLFADVPQAWVNGPVYPTIYHEYKDMTEGMCDKLSVSDFGYEDAIDGMTKIYTKLNLTQEQLKCIDSVITMYGAKTQNQLIMMTHCEDPWCEKRENIAPFLRSTEELSLDTMYSYYKKRYENNRKS